MDRRTRFELNTVKIRSMYRIQIHSMPVNFDSILNRHCVYGLEFEFCSCDWIQIRLLSELDRQKEQYSRTIYTSDSNLRF